MTQHQLNEKISKIHNNTMKASQGLAKKAGESAKKISMVNSSMANNVAKNVQLKSVEMLTMKSPADIVNIFNNETSSEFLQEMNEYQNELKNVLKEYSQEMAEFTDEILENTKVGVDEWFNTLATNVPNGNGALIKPYQSAFHAAIEGFEQAYNLSKNMMNSMESISSGAIQMAGATSNPKTSSVKSKN